MSQVHLLRALAIMTIAMTMAMAQEDEAASCASQEKKSSERRSKVAQDHLLLQVGKSFNFSRQSSSSADQRCPGLSNVERSCSVDGCKVLADGMRGRSCNQYCSESTEADLVCVGAWEEVEEDCNVKMTLSCSDSWVDTSDLLCECAPRGEAPAPPPEPEAGASFPIPTFFWNVHWECSLAARGASSRCKHRVGRRFARLALQENAQIAASIELSNGMSEPADLVGYGLTGWTQVNGPCSHHSGGGDSAALVFAPGWIVQDKGGGCLRDDGDTRAFAVARVVPPRAVPGCSSLCVVAIHAPHQAINAGKPIVDKVCGDSARSCGIAMGDWNIPASGVSRLWANLIGGRAPMWAHPDERTCCFPDSHHFGIFDHLATNIPGATHNGHTVYPYQLLEENPRKQHKAVSVTLVVPGVADPLTVAGNVSSTNVSVGMSSLPEQVKE
eukprot:TRINITY_DN3682_c0_g2_i1.p1 TRINITY_DN3682_c0_g2~~TRINITY_DN3682_c0_g2_i1.p1  ORF type:complete len:442 (+),score=57.51 TRINITY_DN3682_c0_g2_i1:160-1485(+)